MSGELKAGFFVLAALSALVFMTTRLTQNSYSMKGTKTYYANVKDATGLLSKTKVKMAGLDVGQLQSLDLVGGQARVSMAVAADLVVHKDATIAIKSIGFLGDKYLELNPGTGNSPILEEGGYVKEGLAAGSLDQLTAKTSELVDNLKEITDTLKDALKGSGMGDGTRLDRILDNMEKFSEGLAQMDKLGELADRLVDVAANVREITAKVKRGEGTVGKLLSDSETVDRLNQTLSGVNKFLTKADKLQLIVDTRAGVLTAGGSRSMFNLILQPTFDKYYLFGVASRPQGVQTRSRVATTVNPDQSGAATTTTSTTTTDETGVSFNAQFAKRWADFTLRLGLFESTAGVGLDYNFLEDKAKVTAEVYRYRKGFTPQVNVTAEMQIYKPLFVWLGGDYLSDATNRSFFVGGGIRFNDQDLKSLLTAAATAAAR